MLSIAAVTKTCHAVRVPGWSRAEAVSALSPRDLAMRDEVDVADTDQQLCLERMGELARVTWLLRDSMLEQGAITPEVVRLEEAAHLLDRSIAQLATALQAELPAGCLPAGKPRSPL